MELNYKNALSQNLISDRSLEEKIPASPILHFGVGGFHRAHQAWALQALINRETAAFNDWAITGVCMLPGDKPFVEVFRRQDCLYFVQSFAADGTKETALISTIKEILQGQDDYRVILSRIAAPETRVISFTITEGGYNVDYNQHAFIWETPAVQEDLKGIGTPKTVFRILAEGLKQRMTAGAGSIILMSCDNVQDNGDILKFSLLSFLEKFDPSLIEWVEQHVCFVKTMVDRITPATSQAQKEDFARENGFEDNCLVVCEDFFQWVIQDDPSLNDTPYGRMGATLVKDVAPYEQMKLRLLNGGHSLTGLLGYVLGYDRIHTAVTDIEISRVYRLYCAQEVIPTLTALDGVNYGDYVQQLVARFSNPMINDSTARIISGSTDKLPKFVLPVILEQLAQNDPQIKRGVLILAAWYYYLAAEFEKNQMQEVPDLNRDLLLNIFKEADFQPAEFIDKVPFLASLKGNATVKALFKQYVQGLILGAEAVESRRLFIHQLLEEEGAHA